MLGLSVTTRILPFTGATDMRKGFDGLSALVTAAGEDPYSGHLYVFVSRRRDRAKILAFQKAAWSSGTSGWTAGDSRFIYRTATIAPSSTRHNWRCWSTASTLVV